MQRGASAGGVSNAECSSQSMLSGVGGAVAPNDYNDMSKKVLPTPLIKFARKMHFLQAKLDSSSNGERVHNITNR